MLFKSFGAMRIILVNAINYGGAFSALKKYEAELENMGHECCVVTPWSSRWNQFIKVKAIRLFLRICYKMLLRKEAHELVSTQVIPTGLKKYLDQKQADYVIFFWVSDSISLSEIDRLRTLFFWRQSDNNLVLPFEHFDEKRVACRPELLQKWIHETKKRFIVKNSGKLFGPSKKTVDPINLISPNSAFILPTPLGNVYQTLKHNRSSETNDTFTFGFVSHRGQDLGRKNWDDTQIVLEAIAKQRSIKLLHRGGDNLNSQKFRVENLGFIEKEQDKIRYFYDKINILIFLSKNDNAPQVISEALARGCPTVCYDITGVREEVIKYDFGFVLKNTSQIQLRKLEEFMNKTTKMNRVENSKAFYRSREKINVSMFMNANG